MNRYVFIINDFHLTPHVFQPAIYNEEPFIGSFHFYIGNRKRTSRRDIITTNSLVGDFLQSEILNIWDRIKPNHEPITIFCDQEVEKRIVNLVLWKYDERQEQIDLMNANIKTLSKIDGITTELAKINDNLIELMAKIAWKQDIKQITNQAGSLDEEELLIDEE